MQIALVLGPILLPLTTVPPPPHCHPSPPTTRRGNSPTRGADVSHFVLGKRARPCVVTHEHDRDASVNAGGRCTSGVGGGPDCGSRHGCEAKKQSGHADSGGECCGINCWERDGTRESICLFIFSVYSVVHCPLQPISGLHITLATHCCDTRKKTGLSVTL